MSDPKIVARYFERTEAVVARSALEAAGIPAHLADENITRLAWFYSLAIGGNRLFVPEERLQEARALLATNSRLEKPRTHATTAPETVKIYGDCQVCGSDEVGYTQRDRRLRARYSASRSSRQAG